MAKLTRITIETDSLWVFRARKPFRAWCPRCGGEVEMIPLDEVGIVSNLRPEDVQAWMESEELHHIRSPDSQGKHNQGSNSQGMICLDSMLKRLRRTPADSPRDEKQK